MPKITIEIKSEKLFDLLVTQKERIGSWKGYLILCMIRDQKHRLNLPGGGIRKEQRGRFIKLLQLEVEY